VARKKESQRRRRNSQKNTFSDAFLK
jgi:hypothetical protein